MTTRYSVVRAKSAFEAKKLCEYQVGDMVRVVQVEAVANNDGTFSMFPIIEPAPRQPDLKSSTKPAA